MRGWKLRCVGRGAHHLAVIIERDRGIIPACAGNSPERSWRSHPTRDHPRRRGELKRFEAIVANPPGSSPQARGTQVREVDRPGARGIIPAGAGNSRTRPHGSRDRWDHPRSRGELKCAYVARVSFAGSSPQARGTPSRRRPGMCHPGIIPAGAGNSRRGLRRGWRRGDHPRRRGELSIPNARVCSNMGSSPQARGTRP